MSDRIIIFPEERKKNGKNNDKVGTIESSKEQHGFYQRNSRYLGKRKQRRRKMTDIQWGGKFFHIKPVKE